MVKMNQRELRKDGGSGEGEANRTRDKSFP